MTDPTRIKLTIQLPRKQLHRLNLLRLALAEKLDREMDIDEMVEQIINDFLEQG